MEGSHRPSVWIVEDNSALRETLTELLDQQSDMQCTHALPDCEQLLDALDAGEAPDAALMDPGIPGLSGIDGIHRLHGLSPTTRVLELTIRDDERVFEAISAGAATKTDRSPRRAPDRTSIPRRKSRTAAFQPRCDRIADVGNEPVHRRAPPRHTHRCA